VVSGSRSDLINEEAAGAAIRRVGLRPLSRRYRRRPPRRVSRLGSVCVAIEPQSGGSGPPNGGKAFAEVFGPNANAYGTCVSQQARASPPLSARSGMRRRRSPSSRPHPRVEQGYASGRPLAAVPVVRTNRATTRSRPGPPSAATSRPDPPTLGESSGPLSGDRREKCPPGARWGAWGQNEPPACSSER
jgi:hypothetical protein